MEVSDTRRDGAAHWLLVAIIEMENAEVSLHQVQRDLQRATARREDRERST